MRIKRSPSEGLANGGASETADVWAWRSMVFVVNGAHATHSQAIDRSRPMLNAPQRQAILMTRSALLLVLLAPLAFAQQGTEPTSKPTSTRSNRPRQRRRLSTFRP